MPRLQDKSVDYDSSVSEYASERKSGKVIKSSRLFGVEFEMVPSQSVVWEILHKNTSKLIPKYWGNSFDGSLSNRDYGLEIQTPPMRMDKGEQAIHRFCETFSGGDWLTDSSCGLHVHIDARDIREKPVLARRLFMSYFVLDYSIMHMVEKNRRANKYCSPMDASRAKGLAMRTNGGDKGWKVTDVMVMKPSKVGFLETLFGTSIDRIPRMLTDNYNEARYYGINFHNLYGNYGTVEVRYMEGTLDSNDIIHWIALHQHIVDNARLIRESEAVLLYGIKGPKTRLRSYAKITNMPQYILDWACERIDKFK